MFPETYTAEQGLNLHNNRHVNVLLEPPDRHLFYFCKTLIWLMGDVFNSVIIWLAASGTDKITDYYRIGSQASGNIFGAIK